jgi:tetratricopeptide (TPR) repeat protein
MIITGTVKDTKKLPDYWKRLSGNNSFCDILKKLIIYNILKGKFLVIFLLIILFSCTSKDHYRRRIDQMNAGEDKYLVAASICEYWHLFPGDLKQLSIYAEILLQHGYFSECIELCDNILKEDKKNWQVYYTRALAFSDIWKFDKCISDFNTLFKLITPTAEMLEQYHSEEIYNNIYRKILSMDSLIAITPENSGLYLQRANLYLNMNEPLPAVADYQYCLDLKGFNPDIIYNKFRAEILLNDYEQAKKDIEMIRSTKVTAGSLDPDFLSKLVDDAKKYEDMIRENPGNITGYMEMAKIYTFLKIENKAVEYLKSAQKIQPDNEQIKYNLAVVYAVAGKMDLARQLVVELENSGVKIPEQLKKMIK